MSLLALFALVNDFCGEFERWAALQQFTPDNAFYKPLRSYPI